MSLAKSGIISKLTKFNYGTLFFWHFYFLLLPWIVVKERPIITIDHALYLKAFFSFLDIFVLFIIVVCTVGGDGGLRGGGVGDLTKSAVVFAILGVLKNRIKETWNLLFQIYWYKIQVRLTGIQLTNRHTDNKIHCLWLIKNESLYFSI